MATSFRSPTEERDRFRGVPGRPLLHWHCLLVPGGQATGDSEVGTRAA